MKQKFTVVAGTSHRVIKDKNQLGAIGSWFYSHYSHKAEDGLASEIILKAKGKKIYEENNKIFLIKE